MRHSRSAKETSMTTAIRTDTPVTVGVDGSRFATAAVRLAAGEARMRGRRLHIVHAIAWPEIDMPVHDDLRGPIENQLRERGEKILAVAAATARSVAADLDITTEIRLDASATALVDASRQSDLVIVGERGHSGLAGLILGSTAHHVAAHAHGPVIIARGEATTGGPVVLGVDGSPGSAAVVVAAFAEASMRGAALDAVHAWRLPVFPAPDDIMPLLYDATSIERAEARLLAEALTAGRLAHPEVAVTQTLVRAPARRTLLDHAEGAQLLVVGTRAHSRLASTPFGSVTTAMVNHATCPVMVVPSG
jgi:nucleotide-binding universal stress UspA family protein